jgi:hypothetical protein
MIAQNKKYVKGDSEKKTDKIQKKYKKKSRCRME